MFASRNAYRPAKPAGPGHKPYRLRRKLGSDGMIGGRIRKPKGMHRRTFERLIAKIETGEAAVNGYTALLVRRLRRR